MLSIPENIPHFYMIKIKLFINIFIEHFGQSVCGNAIDGDE